jgi:hypothetical protein
MRVVLYIYLLLELAVLSLCGLYIDVAWGLRSYINTSFVSIYLFDPFSINEEFKATMVWDKENDFFCD